MIMATPAIVCCRLVPTLYHRERVVLETVWMICRDTNGDAWGVVLSSAEFDMRGLALSTVTPHSCTRRVPVRWRILTAGGSVL